jgi:hypothetical protein
MHTLLIVLTSLLVAVVVALSVVLARLMREDRQRSDARVAALAMMAADATPYAEPEPDPAPATRERIETAPRTGRAHEHSILEPLPDFDLRPTDSDAAPALFAEHGGQSPWGRRFAVIGTLSAVLAAVLLAATFGGRHQPTSQAASTPAAQTSNIAPLELLELQHALESQRLTISGVVRNPAGAAPRSHLIATAIVFGPDGNFLTSDRAPVDVAAIAPGQESKFALTIPVTGEVSRYRIGFRSDDGTVVAHVDKRTTGTFARKQEQP